MNSNPFRLDQWLRSTLGQVFLVFLAIAAFYLVTEHTAHVLGVLPYALVLLCPLLHLFMHGGHGSHAGEGRPKAKNDDHSDYPQGHVH